MFCVLEEKTRTLWNMLYGPSTLTRDFCSTHAVHARNEEASCSGKRAQEMIMLRGILHRDYQTTDPPKPYARKHTAKLSPQDLLCIKRRCRRGGAWIMRSVHALTKAQPTAASLAINPPQSTRSSIFHIPHLTSCIGWFDATEITPGVDRGGTMPHHPWKHGHQQGSEQKRPRSLSSLPSSALVRTIAQKSQGLK